VPGAAEEFGAEGGVALLLPYLSPRGAAAAESRLMIAAVDCVWSTVPPCETNSARYSKLTNLCLEKQVTHTTTRQEQHHKQTTTQTNPPHPPFNNAQRWRDDGAYHHPRPGGLIEVLGYR